MVSNKTLDADHSYEGPAMTTKIMTMEEYASGSMAHDYVQKDMEEAYVVGQPQAVPTPKQTKTYSILVGNSDDRLSQERWNRFVNEVNLWVEERQEKRWFMGFSASDSMWQNACWVVDLYPLNVMLLGDDLQQVAGRFNQDSIAFVEGNVSFIYPKKYIR